MTSDVVLLQGNAKLNPQAEFQTKSFYLLIFISSGKKKGGGGRGGENSLHNPSANTILIHIHVQYLLTCIAYNGGYQLGYSVEGKGQSYQKTDEAHSLYSPNFM